MDSLLIVPLHSMSEFCNAVRLSDVSVILFEASWMGPSGIAKRRSVIDSVIRLGVKKMFMVRVLGNDDAEDYVINWMRVSSLPAIGIYSRGGFLECKVSINVDALDISKNDFFAIETTLRRLALVEWNNSVKVLDPLTEVPFSSSNSHGRVTILEAVCACLLGSTVTKCPSYRSDLSLEDFKPFTIFISGDRSSVGKSTTCLAIIAALVKLGVDPNAIAYIKPVTQCESEQPITRYCNKVGIVNQGIGPIVFYKGFTRWDCYIHVLFKVVRPYHPRHLHDCNLQSIFEG